MTLWDQLDALSEPDDQQEPTDNEKQTGGRLWQELGMTRKLSAPTEMFYGALRGLSQLPSGLARAGEAIYSQPEAIGRKFADLTGQDYDALMANENSQNELAALRGMAGGFRKTAETVEKIREPIRPSEDVAAGGGGARWWLSNAPEVTGQLASILAVGALTSPVGAATIMSAGAGGSTYQSAKERMKARGDMTDFDIENKAGLEGGVAAAAEYFLGKLAIGEFIGKNRSTIVGVISKKLAATRPGRVAGAMAGEGFEEIGADISGMTMQWLAENDPKAFDGALEKLATSGALGAFGGGVMAGPMQAYQQSKYGNIAQQAAAEKNWKDQVREARHTFVLEGMTSDWAGTPEGLAKIQELAQKADPSRKDFESAGYDPAKLRLNGDQRKAYVQSLANRFQVQPAAVPQAAVPPAGSPTAPVSPPSETPPSGEQTPAPTPTDTDTDWPTPTPPPVFPGAAEEIQAAGKEFGRSLEADTSKIAEILKKYATGPETPEAQQARLDTAKAFANMFTKGQVEALRGVTGGTPGAGALKQQTQETVKQVQEITGGKGVGNEKKMFSPGGIMARATRKAKQVLGMTRVRSLTRNSLKDLKSRIKDGKYRDPFKAGSAMESNLNMAGIDKLAARAANEVAEFVAEEGGEKFANYYEQQNVEEDQVIAERFPEFAGNTPEAMSLNQFRRGVINAVASAQTELSKNTSETIGAWEGIRSTGRVPVLFTESTTETDAETGKTKTTDKPIYQLPKPKTSRAEGPLDSEVTSIIEALQELRPSVPQDVMDVLLKKSPVPKGLVQLGRKAKGQPVLTHNDYLYEWFAPKYVPTKSRNKAFTTSKGLVARLFVELETSSPDEFRNRVRSAFEIGGGTSMENKAENYRIIDKLLQQFSREVNGRVQPDFAAIVAYLNERVPTSEINSIRTKNGFGEFPPKVMNDIIDTVWVAEGQEELVPRTFIFGTKVGAYMLNRMADANPRNADYNTMDVWESRFWRYIVDEKLSSDAGIASGAERKVFMRLARAFVGQMKANHGIDMKTSAGQAARWYLEKRKAAQAGYGKAGETETIPEWTQRRMGDWRHVQLGLQETGSVGNQVAALLMGEEYDQFKAAGEEPVLPKKQADRIAKMEAPPKPAPVKLTKMQKREVKDKARGQKLMFSDLEFEPAPKPAPKPALKLRTTVAKAVQTIAPTGPTTVTTTADVPVQEQMVQETKAEPGQARGEAPGVPDRFVRPNGWVNLFRYSRSPRGARYNIDPEQTKGQGYSRRDYDASNVKRTFFYLDPTQKEAIIGNNMYGAEIEADRVYDLMTDPEGLKEKYKWGPKTDLQDVMNVLKKNGWAGIYYRTADQMELVNLFVPVTGQSIESQADFTPASETTTGTAAAETATPPTEAPGISTPSIVATLFQKVGGRVVGSMEQILKNGKIQMMLRAFKGADLDTGIEEMAHALRRLVITRELTAEQRGFSDDLLKAIEDHYGVKNGEWTVQAEEDLARDFRKRLKEGLKGIKVGNTKLQKAYSRMASFLTNFYENVKKGVLGDQATSPVMDKLFEQLVERRARLAKGQAEYAQRAVVDSAARHSADLAEIALNPLNGGFTFDLKTGQHQTDGYAVAPSKASEYKIHLASTPPADIPRLIREFVEQNKNTQAKPAINLGAWISEGYLWLDNSTVKMDKAAAIEVARANQQKAIWDLKNNVEIPIEEKTSEIKQAPDNRPKDTKKARTPGRKAAGSKRKTSGRARNEAPGPALQGQQPAQPGTEAAGSPVSTADPNSLQATLGEVETQETIDSRLKAQGAGSVDWSPYTGPKGQRTGKAKPPLEVVRDILARVGIVAASYDPKSQPDVYGYYMFTTTMAKKIFDKTGRELWLAADHLADIGTAIHEVAHYLDNLYNISGFGWRMSALGGVQPTLPTNGMFDSLPATTKYQFQLLDYQVAQHGVLRQDKLRGMAEGFSEALRIYCQSPDPSATLPPEVKGFIDSLVMQHPDVAKLLNETRSEFQAYLNSPVAERVAMALTSPDARNADPAESYFARQDRTGRSRGWWRLFILKIQNKIRDIESMEKRTRQIFQELWKNSTDDVNAAWDTFVRAAGGLPSQFNMLAQSRIAFHTDHAVRFGILDPLSFAKIGNGAADIFAGFNGRKEIDEFGKYMYAKVAMLRWAQAQAEGTQYVVGQVDPATLQQLVSDIEAGPNAAKYQQAMRDVTDYFNNLLKLEVAYGLKTQGEMDAMIQTHDIYMPFYRQQPSRTAKGGTGGKFLGVKSSIRKLKGGSVYPVLDVFQAIVDKTSDIMSDVVRAAGEQNFLSFAEISGVSGDFVRKLTAEEAAGVKGVTKVVRNGKTLYYKIDDDLKEALTQINPQMGKVAATILGTIGAPVDLAKKFMVTYNIPFFTTKNYLRDIKTTALRGLQDMTGIESADTTYLTARATKRGSVDALKAVFMRPDQKTDVDILFDRMGLTRQTRVRTSRSPKRSRSQTRRLFLGKKDRTAVMKMKDWAGKTGEYLEGINDAVELGPRREAFLMTLQLLGQTQGAGFTVDKNGRVTGTVPQWALTRAGNNALEVTTNFNRRGQLQPYMEPMFMFFNAAVQGTAGMSMTAKNVLSDLASGKAGKPHAKRFAIAVMIAATAKIAQMSMMAAMPGSDDDDEMSMLDLWAEKADYVRGASDVWMFSPRFGLSIPREREWGFFYRAVDDAVAKAVRDGANPWSVHLFAKELLKPANIWKQTVTEIDQRVPLSGGLLPMAAQLFFNYDLYRSKNIESKWEQGKLPKYRYDETTGTVARTMGALSQAAADATGIEGLAISPRKLDFIMRNEFGSAPGKLVEDILAVGAPEKMRRSNVPFVGPYLTDPTPRQSIADFYELRERSAMEFDEWKNDRKNLPDSTVQRILDNEGTIGVADSVLKIIREAPDEQISQENKAKYQTGVARWALERNPLDEYPNPLLQYLSTDIPDELKLEIVKVLKRELKSKVRVDETMKEKPERYRQAIEAKARLKPRLIPKGE